MMAATVSDGVVQHEADARCDLVDGQGGKNERCFSVTGNAQRKSRYHGAAGHGIMAGFRGDDPFHSPLAEIFRMG